jgi:hypothetical protein
MERAFPILTVLVLASPFVGAAAAIIVHTMRS